MLASAALPAFSQALLRAEVIHWWTSGGESAAAKTLAEAYKAQGGIWVDTAKYRTGGGPEKLGAIGLHLSRWISTHVSYEVCSWFIPLVEVNWFHVIDSGNGTGNYPDQVGGAVPAVIEFEGGDLFNLGAVNSDNNRDLVTAAIGFRSRLTESIDAGVAYEIPLTNDENSLMQERVTVDLVWKF